LIDWVADSEHLNAFAATLQQESDRACAVLGAAMLDHIIGDLIRSAMAEDTPKTLFEGYGPLASFSARIDVSLGLGLLSRDEHYDLHLVRRIRNAFAHDMNHKLGFASQPITHRVALLKLADALFANPSIPTSEDTPRTRFQIEIGGLTYSLSGVRAHAVERAEIPEDYVGWLRTAKKRRDWKQDAESRPPPNGGQDED
jgi:DNA-binding MltR family transcriptional regulator